MKRWVDVGTVTTGIVLQTLDPAGSPEFGLSQRFCGQSPVKPACTTRIRKSMIVVVFAVCRMLPAL